MNYPEVKSLDDKSFSEIYARYERAIFSYIAKRVPDRETARDVVQEIFLKVHRFRGSYLPSQEISSWLWTIARNTLTDWLRKNRHEIAERSRCRDEGKTPIEEILPSELLNSEELLVRKSDRRFLRSVLRQLTSQQRRVLWLRMVHQLSYKEISKKLGLSLSAVKCLVYRAKQALAPMRMESALA